MKYTILFFLISLMSMSVKADVDSKMPVDYVNPYIGNISHLLVPTYPTIHLPNSMLRVYPERENYTGNKINGLPIIVTSHRGSSAFNLSPFQGDVSNLKKVISFGYDNEIVKPYFYSVDLDDYGINADYAVSHQSAIYELSFTNSTLPPYLMLNSGNGEMSVDGNIVKGYQKLQNNTIVYLYLEIDRNPEDTGVISDDKFDNSKKSSDGENACVALKFSKGVTKLKVRYGVSFISSEQAAKNLHREIKDYDLKSVESKGRRLWNETLGKIQVNGDDEDQKTIFYTSLYRTYERMICISEDGNYFSAYDGKVHNDNGIPFYTDDWIWDTYRATHPLRIIIEPQMESAMINSYVVMTQQMPRPWMPNFPEVTGDSRRMNSNHGVAMVADAYVKGLRGFDLAEAYQACKAAITEKTLAPWSSKPAGVLDRFFKDHGYFPSLAPGESETVSEVHGWERRQPVAVTLGTVYDEWCLAQIAKSLKKNDEYKYFSGRSLNYHKIFNTETKFFHPKDTFGNFMPDLDYRFPPGIGGRDAYDENTGFVYKWDVQHNIGDLVAMMGGKKAFVDELEKMYDTPLGKGRPDFYHIYADHTGNVGQFSMGNEPSMHVPYLYNYAGQPWRTQKRVRSLLKQWFRNDLMGIPGDEDGGGLTAFVVFSQIGFYPVTPGLPMYVIGSPVFRSVKLDIGNGKTFEVECVNYSPDNKYIQSASLNGKIWNKSWFSHDDLMKGGKLVFIMGKHPDKDWAASDDALPPSFSMPGSR
ncbi:glycoside hydrolase family 92 protein [Dysgonomonas capnocytophagoides]|uniref:Glycoside hydrolase family 92 protein n=2 Tax=Dysgonomonas capnocytophagoides TaxID=45254 RepID=A0A4Y8L4Q9_9BACT|nr:GH92 family glycosyl hydrolase [Dysgonomonas capnocytophagoides]TFD96482.1 glycoside hydrolase family 92 protein [Dysgonomonas capnocytophagoides]